MGAEPGDDACGSGGSGRAAKKSKDPFYQNTISILAMENDQVLRRIEYHFTDVCRTVTGWRMWTGFMCCQEARHKGVAQGAVSGDGKKTAGNMGLTNII